MQLIKVISQVGHVLIVIIRGVEGIQIDTERYATPCIILGKLLLNGCTEWGATQIADMRKAPPQPVTPHVVFDPSLSTSFVVIDGPSIRL